MPAHGKRLTLKQKRNLLHRVVRDKLSVSKACREADVSRDTFYKLYRSWLENNKKVVLGKRSYKRHPIKKISRDHIQRVREIVKNIPEASKYAISQELATKYPDFKLSPSGVYWVLKNLNLNLPSSRISWASNYASIPEYTASFTDKIVSGFDLRLFIKTLGLTLLLATAGVYSSAWWINLIISSSTPSSIGIVFASIALIFGTIFLLY